MQHSPLAIEDRTIEKVYYCKRYFYFDTDIECEF